MINKSNSLSVLFEDNSVITDYSHKMSQYERDNINLSITSSEDYLYFGYDKPINAVYINLTNTDDTEGSLELEFWNGSSWEEVEELSDDTLGLYRSGFIRWERELDSQVSHTINSTSRIWYRITLNQDRLSMTFKGLNLIFSDDYELSLEQPYILDQDFLGSESSHIKTHAAVKREIIQRFRNKNYIKYNYNTGEKEDITVWDLLDIDEVKLAATYLALSKIYYQMSDEPDDVWRAKSSFYEERYNKFIEIARLSLDVDDDGLTSIDENKPNFINKYMRR